MVVIRDTCQRGTVGLQRPEVADVLNKVKQELLNILILMLVILQGSPERVHPH